MSVDCKKVAVFCYGSNSTKQLQERVKNSSLMSYGAYLCGYRRIFAGNAVTWGGGGAASIIETKNDHDKVVGTIAYLTSVELDRLDRFEGIPSGGDPFCGDEQINVYRRQYMDAYLVDNTKINVVAYIKNNHDWHDYPSDAYLQACYNHLSPFWPDLDQDQAINIHSQYEWKGRYYGPSSLRNIKHSTCLLPELSDP
jgi:hypothetical protein